MVPGAAGWDSATSMAATGQFSSPAKPLNAGFYKVSDSALLDPAHDGTHELPGSLHAEDATIGKRTLRVGELH